VVTAAALVAASAGLFDPRQETPTAPTGTPGSATVALDARTVLLAAASQAEAQQEKTGDWWRSESVQRDLLRVLGEPSYLVYTAERSEMWTPYETGGERVDRSQKLGFDFPTPADEAAWKQAGSPSRVSLDVPKPKPKGGPASPGIGSYEVDRLPGREETHRAPLLDGDKVFWLGKNVTMKDLQGLPDDPKRLKAWLLRSYKGHDTESSGVPMTSEKWLYQVATGLIADMPVTPKVRGAAFRMLAELETVRVIENVTDLEGRTGTAVAMEKESDGAVILDRLLFDRTTGRALQRDNVVLKPGGYQKGLPEGSLNHAVTIVSSGWTDENP